MTGSKATWLPLIGSWAVAIGWISSAVDSAIAQTETWVEREAIQQDSSPVYSVAFSPDGSLIATANKEQTVNLWNARTRQLRLTYRGHNNGVLTVGFSPDGKTVASGGYDGIKLWSVADGSEQMSLLVGEHTVSLAFSRNGEWIAAGNGSGFVRLWNLKAGKEHLTLEGQRIIDSGSIGLLAISLAFSPDGRLLAAGSYDRTVKVWEVASGKLMGTLRWHDDSVFSIAFSPDGKTLASASADGTVKLWNIAERREIATLKLGAYSALSVAISPDGKTLAAGVYQKYPQSVVRVWDLATVTEKTTLRGPSRQGLISLAFSPDGKKLLGACGDFYSANERNGEVKVWEVTKRK